MPIFFALASVGGLGGGVVMFPILIGLFQFSTKDSISISTAIVFESAFIRFVCSSAYAPHPDRENATEVDYNLVRVVFPAFLVGSFFGVIVSVALGELILGVMLMTFLALITIQVLWKSISLYKEETIKMD